MIKGFNINKDTLRNKYVIATIVLIVVAIISIISYFAFKPKNLGGVEPLIEDRIADYILSFDEKGNATLINIKNQNLNKISPISENGEYIYSKAQNENIVYALNKNNNKLYSIEENNQNIKIEQIEFNVDNSKEILWFLVDKSYIVYEAENEKQEKSVNVVYREKNENKEIPNIKNVENSYLIDNDLIVSSEYKIYKISLIDFNTISIDLGDEINKFEVLDNELFVQNSFGSGLNTSIILNIDINDLAINNLYKFDSKNIDLVKNLTDKSKIIPYYQTLEYEGKNTTSILSLSNELKKDRLSYKFNQNNNIDMLKPSYYLNGYLYCYDGKSNSIKAINLGRKDDFELEFKQNCIYYLPIMND